MIFEFFGLIGYAQKDTTIVPDEEEDFSQYNNVETVPTKRYCSSKILGISPSKLISVVFFLPNANMTKSIRFPEIVTTSFPRFNVYIP